MQYLHAAHGQGVWRLKKAKPQPTKEELTISINAKIKTSRSAMVAKLRSLGATRVKELDVKHYYEFKKYIDSLP
jgi:hypothetical protein